MLAVYITPIIILVVFPTAVGWCGLFIPVPLPPISSVNPTAGEIPRSPAFDARRAKEVSIVPRVFWRQR
jgi:hypothetical protein